MSVHIKTLDEPTLDCGASFLAPKLSDGIQKGQGGIIGIIGGSHDNTGAPYFAGMAALKTGADSVHIICPVRESSAIVQTHSPNLNVHSVLDAKYTLDRMKMWLPKVHVVVIGPGLDLENPYLLKEALKDIVKICRETKKPLILDGDSLLYLAGKPGLLKNYPALILTPNATEYTQLFGYNRDPHQKILDTFGPRCVVLRKGAVDEIYSADTKGFGPAGGTCRRCDGQGHFLTGALATFYFWALSPNKAQTLPYDTNRVFLACYGASKLTKECGSRAFDEAGRSMLTTDMLDKIGKVFKEQFETTNTV